MAYPPEGPRGPRSTNPEAARTEEQYYALWVAHYLEQFDDLIKRHDEVKGRIHGRLAMERSRKRVRKGEVDDLLYEIKVHMELETEFKGQQSRLLELQRAGYSGQNMRIFMVLLSDIVKTLADFRVNDPH